MQSRIGIKPEGAQLYQTFMKVDIVELHQDRDRNRAGGEHIKHGAVVSVGATLGVE